MTFRFMIVFCLCLIGLPLAGFSAFAAEAPASAMTRIVVPAHDIARGETIADSDLTYRNAVAAQLRGGVVTAMDALSGMEARRFLRAGEPVRASDVRKPILVRKGATVTMTFHAPGIALVATGRAMSEGGMGETVSVLNPVSYRQIMAMVTGPGTVRAIGTAASTAAGRGGPSRMAAIAHHP